MESIIIMGLDGPNVTGTEWLIREGQRELEQVKNKNQAINRARNKWAAPDQPIKVVNTRGRTEWIREGNKGDKGGNDDSGMMSSFGMGSSSGPDLPF